MKRMLALILVVLFGSVGLAYGQSAKDAVKALKKLEAKVESGMSYQKYREALGDTNAEVKLFLESKNAKKNPELANSIKKIMGNYQDAADLWKTIADHPERHATFSPDEKLSPTNPGGLTYRPQWHVNLVETSKKMFKKYPKAYDKLKYYGLDGSPQSSQVVTSPLTGKTLQAQKLISLEDFLAVIWGEASKELKKLSFD
ncbi:MAG: hypothetical protein ACYDIC_05610 [Desulfobaccales bacterium]